VHASENRKLAAILAADVVGYSKLAGADEDRTLARLRALRSDLFDPMIAVHNGRVSEAMVGAFADSPPSRKMLLRARLPSKVRNRSELD
jgi:class 3 adenylate cyclase